MGPQGIPSKLLSFPLRHEFEILNMLSGPEGVGIEGPAGPQGPQGNILITQIMRMLHHYFNTNIFEGLQGVPGVGLLGRQG